MLSKKIDEIFSPISADLAGVRREITSEIRTMAAGFRGVEPVLKYFFGMPGKFLRSGLVLLSGACAGRQRHPLSRRLAAAVEMIHSASLIHDDIVDGSEKRRGRKSLPSRFGNRVSVLAGDLLFTHSLAMLEQEFDNRILGLLLGSVKLMCGGEILHLSQRLKTLGEYERFVEAKTSSLMESSCVAGAVLAGADRRSAEAAGRFGLHFGTAYQLMDDFADRDVRLEFKLDLRAVAGEYAVRAEHSLEGFRDSAARRSLIAMARELVSR